MSLIYVRAKEGRVARVSPKGAFIPHTEFIGVRPSPYLTRLAHVHGDIEVSSTPTPKQAAPKPAPSPKKNDE